MAQKPGGQEPGPRPVAATLAGFAHGLTLDAIPAAVLAKAKWHILDALGCGLAASRSAFADRLAGGLRALGGLGAVAAIGRAERLMPREAALFNAALIHMLDFDDTHIEALVHVSAAGLPPALAMASDRDRGTRDLLLAYVIAGEANARIGLATPGAFHRKGLHTTAVLGGFGVALGVGRLLGLDCAQLLAAQGIALSRAGGTLEWIADGASVKRLHPGLAGVAGLSAAALAAAGVTGPARVYEGRFGLYAALLGPEPAPALGAVTRGLGQDWEMLRVGIKPYPLVHPSHAFVDAAIALVRRHGVAAQDILRATLIIDPGAAAVVCEPLERKRRPANAYEAQFSAPFATAVALARGRFGRPELDPACLADPEIRALAGRIDHEADPESGYPRHYSGALRVTLRDGRTLSHREPVNRGAAERPLSDAEILAKFRDNAEGACSPAQAERIAERVLALETDGPAAALAELLAGR